MVILRKRTLPVEKPKHVREGEYLGPNYKRWLNEKLFLPVRDKKNHDESRLVFVFGDAGSGKSTLSFLSMKQYYEGEAPISHIASDMQSLGQVFRTIREKSSAGEPAGFFMHDEANYSKYSQGRGYEKKTREYFSVQRERNYVFFFNSAQGSEFDRDFLNLFHYCFFVDKKGVFYVIPSHRLVAWIADANKLNVRTFSDFVEELAIFRSTWKKYLGADWQEYLSLKRARMDAQSEEVEDFFLDKDTMAAKVAAKKIGISAYTATRWLKRAIKEGVLEPSIQLASGQFRLTHEHFEAFKKYYLKEGGQ